MYVDVHVHVQQERWREAGKRVEAREQCAAQGGWQKQAAVQCSALPQDGV